MSPVDDSGIDDDPLSFSIGGKSFSWGHLAQLKNAWAFVKEAQKPARGYSNPGSYLNGGVRQFLEYLCERQLAPNQVCVEGYRAHVEQGLQSANTKYEQFSRVREFVRRLQAAGLVESFRVPANLGREPSEHKADLYEIAPVGLDQMSVLQRGRADSLVLKGKADALTRCAVAVAELRLEAVRRFAQKEIAQLHKNFLMAQTAVRRANRFKRVPVQLASSRDEDLLAWAISRYGRMLPSSNSMDPLFYELVKTRFGGTPAMQAFLAPTADSLAPFIALCLADSLCAPNVDDVWNYMFRGCVIPGDTPASASIQFGKLRGAASEYVVEVPLGKPSEWSIGHALRFLHEYTNVCPKLVNARSFYSDGRKRLFLHLDRIATKSLKPLDPGTVVDVLRRFLIRAAEHEPEIIPIARLATGANFRPTHALIESCRNGIFETQRRLRHRSVDTTKPYADRASSRSARATRMVAYEEWLYQNALMPGGEKRETVHTGMGLHCAAVPGAVIPIESGCQGDDICWRPDNCDSGCPEAVLVVEDVEMVAVWMRMASHIGQERPRMQADYPERWSVWEVRLAWYQSLIAKTSARVRKLASDYCQASTWVPPVLT